MTSNGIIAISIERTNLSTTSAEVYQTNGRAVNDYIICDGPDPIIFTVNDGINETSFTLKNGEVNEVSFYFEQLKWKTLTGTSSFRCFAHK